LVLKQVKTTIRTYRMTGSSFRVMSFIKNSSEIPIPKLKESNDAILL